MSDDFDPDLPEEGADDSAADSLHAELGALLRSVAPAAPEVVHRRALSRIRLEREVLLISRTLGGALFRVVTALPDYLSHRSNR